MTENPSVADPESARQSIHEEERYSDSQHGPYRDDVLIEDDTRVTPMYPATPPDTFQKATQSNPGSSDEDNLTEFPALANHLPAERTLVRRCLNFPITILKTVYGFMNPPLWAMIIALIVACIPGLQTFFFTKGTFQYNSITTAVSTAGDCAVPLILVVLGANLAQEKSEAGEALPYSTKTVWTAIVSRMILVPVILLPILAILARFAPISVVDDPIFIVVLFLLIGSPTAIQVASICQLNDVFEQEITKICWYSYAILTIPTTLTLVVLSLECVELNKLGPWLVTKP